MSVKDSEGEGDERVEREWGTSTGGRGGGGLFSVVGGWWFDAVILCFNLCLESSLHSLGRWYRSMLRLRRLQSGCLAKRPLIGLLVGTHFVSFRRSLSKHRISVTEQARKYAAKMGAALLFVETASMQQINIKELFLIALSRHYHFDANIASVSGGKLPLIEYHDVTASSKVGAKNNFFSPCF